MSRVTLTDLMLERSLTRKNYFLNAWSHIKEIKNICKEFDQRCRLLVFGSYVRGNITPDSDIDVLLITNLAASPSHRGRLLATIARKIGLETPFEIHVVTEEEYREWYSRFINNYIEAP
ncbi:MAG: nucleotidyltransferase domain-containing protein [Thermoprotei archaeon]